MKILALDIETSPALADVWGMWQQNVGLTQLRESTRVICFAAKWVGKSTTYFYSEHHHGRDVMVQKAHDLLAEADVVLTWNGKKFDVPHLMREFLEAGMQPPAPFEHIDLCNVVKRRFRFMSAKLQYVSTRLGLSGKVQHEGHTLWVKCLAGDDKAWSAMRTYNKRDVTVLEELYELLKPWIPGHPNAALHEGESFACPVCAGAHLERRGYAFTRLGRFQRYQCRGCGKWVRGTRRVDGGSEVTEIAA